MFFDNFNFHQVYISSIKVNFCFGIALLKALNKFLYIHVIILPQ